MSATRLSGIGRALICAVVLASPAMARAETVLVLPASGGGVSSAIISSARAIFVNELAERDTRLRVIDMDRPPTPEPPPEVVALDIAQRSGASVVILLDLRRQEPVTKLSVTALGVPLGERLFSTVESTTAGPQVLPALVRMTAVKLLQDNRPAAEHRESSTPRTTFFGARAGARAPRDTAGSTPLALPGAGLFVIKQTPRISGEIGFDHVESEQASSTRFGLALALPIDPQANTGAYLGAALHFQWSHFGGQGAAGFSASPLLGWSWHRNESLGLRFEGGLFYDLYSEHAVDRLIPGAAEPHRSWGLELWMGTWL